MRGRTLVSIALACSAFSLQAQSNVNVDQLAAPSSPGIVILGGDVSAIEKPTNTTDLAVSLLSGSNNGSLLPNNYAIDINPFWLFGGQNTTFEEFVANSNIGNNIAQSLQISFASRTTTQASGSDSTAFGFGAKFSILRGPVTKKYLEDIEQIHKKLAVLDLAISDAQSIKEKDDPVIKQILHDSQLIDLSDTRLRDSIERLHQARAKELFAESQEKTAALEKEIDELTKDLEKYGSETKLTRCGVKLDVATVLALSFPMQSFSNREVSRIGVWITGGYETEPKGGNAWSFLGVRRYLRNYGESFTDINDQLLAADNSYFDAGARLIYTYQNKISVSAEWVKRQNISDADMRVDQTTRYTFNLNYQLPDNKLITFTYGKDFSGVVNKSGDLVAALGLIVGIGSKRPL